MHPARPKAGHWAVPKAVNGRGWVGCILFFSKGELDAAELGANTDANHTF